MVKRALVTGCNGFVGRHLCSKLIDEGTHVTGIDLQEIRATPAVEYFQIDMTDAAAIGAFFSGRYFDEIYHLAAVANPRAARDNPAQAIRTSVLGILSILEGCQRNPDTRVLFVGSSEEYQKSPVEEVSYSENSPIEATSIYGASKVAGEAIAKAYGRQFGIKAFHTRSFNHTGPGQAPVYVLSDFAKQIAEARLGLREPCVHTGTIDIERDFLDVRDVVNAYQLIVRRGKAGETYNVASGRAVSLRECILRMAAAAGFESIAINIDQSRVRGPEPKRIVGDNSKIRADTSWTPEIPIERTLADLIAYWLGVLDAEKHQSFTTRP